VSAFDLRLLERLHGHLGVLAIASLLHPAILLRRGKRRAHLAVASAALLPMVTAGLGLALYPAYRAELRRDIFVESLALGTAFERKEHLALGAVLLAWAGAFAYLSSFRTEDSARADKAARASMIAFALSFVLATVAAVLGTMVASHKTF
jgi:hypothetical protein